MEIEYDKFLVKPKSPVQFAFECKGTPYFKFESLDSLPILRKEAMEEVLDQINNKIDNLYLDGFEQAMHECLNAGKLVDAAVLLSHLKERRTHLTSIELLYQLATVLYFDYSENPNVHDDSHAEVKLNLWRGEDIDDFFFKAGLYPQGITFNSTIENLATYTRVQRKKVLQSIRFLLSMLPEGQGRKDLISSLRSQQAILQKLTTSGA